MVKKLSLNGIEICFDDTESTDKEVLILIHGLTRNKEQMYYLRDMFRERFRCITVDTRGHGESSKPETYTLMDHADDMHALITSLRAGKVNILGFSMGSYIAAATGVKYSDEIDHLLLVCTKPSGKTSSIERLAKERGLDMKDLTPKQLQEINLSAAFAPDSQERIRKGDPFLNRVLCERPGVQLSPKELEAESRSLANFDLTGDLCNISCKTLVIAGEYDGINTKEQGQEAADKIPGSEYVLIHGAGHMVQYEKPEEFARIVNSFMDR